MGLAKLTFPTRGFANRRGVMYFSHQMLIGAAGAITSQDATAACGILATKQGTAGQYLFQLLPTNMVFKNIVELDTGLIGALGATNTGSTPGWLTNNITAGTKTCNILQQWSNVSANAAADLPSGTVVITTIALETGL